MTAQGNGKRHAFVGYSSRYSLRGLEHYLRTPCGRILPDDAVVRSQVVAMTEPDVCQNCVRVVGIVGDER